MHHIQYTYGMDALKYTVEDITTKTYSAVYKNLDGYTFLVV